MGSGQDPWEGVAWELVSRCLGPRSGLDASYGRGAEDFLREGV